MKIVKAAPGLDQNNVLGKVLGSGHQIVEYDPSRPLAAQVGDADVLLLRDVAVTAEVMDAGPSIKLLQRYGAHVVGVDFAHARSRGIHVARIPSDVGGASRDVAETAFFLLLAVAKKYPEAQAAIAAGKIGRPRTHRVTGKTLGLIGVGKTGQELAKLAVGFGMRVIAVKRTPDPTLEKELGLGFLDDLSRLDELLAQSDFVSIHLPLEPATVGYVGRGMFAKMKPGCFLINIARGPIVDQDALCDALASGRLAGAGLDVFRDEPIDPGDRLLAFDNVVATPHNAGHTFETEHHMAQVVAENIRLIRQGKAPNYLVAAESHP